jgi:hypothetical protein
MTCLRRKAGTLVISPFLGQNRKNHIDIAHASLYVPLASDNGHYVNFANSVGAGEQWATDEAAWRHSG